MDTIISFDPGLATGVVVAINVDYSKRVYDLGASGVVQYAERSKIFRILERWQPQVIIIEDFKLNPALASAQSWSKFETVKVIERITVYAEQLELANRIAMQDPHLRHSAKTIQPDHIATIKPNRHLTAAYAHLRYFVFMHKQKEQP